LIITAIAFIRLLVFIYDTTKYFGPIIDFAAASISASVNNSGIKVVMPSYPPDIGGTFRLREIADINHILEQITALPVSRRRLEGDARQPVSACRH
jgi:hypothetical protein